MKNVLSYYQIIQSDTVSLANGLLRVLGERKVNIVFPFPIVPVSE